VSDLVFYLIPLICFIGGFISTVAGLGGGLLILACSSLLLPISQVVPLNGVIILAGQITRAIQFRKHIAWNITLPFIPGSIVGATLGTLIYFELPEAFIAIMLGCVMLWLSWVPATDRSRELAARIPQPWFFVGIVHTFLSTVSGAGGLMQSLMVKSKLGKHAVVGTIAGTLLSMAIFKSVGYLVAGFDYRPYLPMILLCWIGGIAGTSLGARCLNIMPDLFFRRLIKGVVTLFALRLFWQAFQLLSSAS
jgi:uncharacterized membrane protein YfcA